MFLFVLFIACYARHFVLFSLFAQSIRAIEPKRSHSNWKISATHDEMRCTNDKPKRGNADKIIESPDEQPKQIMSDRFHNFAVSYFRVSVGLCFHLLLIFFSVVSRKSLMVAFGCAFLGLKVFPNWVGLLD